MAWLKADDAVSAETWNRVSPLVARAFDIHSLIESERLIASKIEEDGRLLQADVRELQQRGDVAGYTAIRRVLAELDLVMEP